MRWQFSGGCPTEALRGQEEDIGILVGSNGCVDVLGN